MNFLKTILLSITILLLNQSLNACDLPKISLSNCLSSPEWMTWNNDYNTIKKVCAEDKITTARVWCSTASAPINKIVFTEVGTSNAYTYYPPAISFQPVSGKIYEVDFFYTNPLIPDYTVKIEAENCMEFDVSQIGSSGCLRTNRPIDFKLELPTGTSANCYDYIWNFGDGSPLVHTSHPATPSHVYSFPFSPSNRCRAYTVTLHMTLNYSGTNCMDCPPCFTVSKTINVCSFCLIAHLPPDDMCIELADIPICLLLDPYGTGVYDETHPIALIDCDGGGSTNVQECIAGTDLNDPNDDIIDIDDPFTITASPNPVTDQAIIDIKYEGMGRLEALQIHNLSTGNVVFSEGLHGISVPYQHPIDFTPFPLGVYEILILTDLGEVATTTVAKE